MTDRKSWGSTVLGWFIVHDESAPDTGSGEASPAPSAAPDAVAVLAATPSVFQTDPPAAIGGQVDFNAVFESAGIDDEERQRVTKAIDLLQSLPAETPVGVRKQIVEASLKAFGVPIDKIIESGVAEIQALECYIRTGAADTQKLLEESTSRIAQYEEQIKQIRAIMDQRVQEQQAAVKACNDKKLSVQQILEFFGQDAVARVVHESPKLHDPSGTGGSAASPQG
ncbi:MAG: hypothetical protein ACM3NQ_04815 [Bacteroidales bacterium]